LLLGHRNEHAAGFHVTFPVYSMKKTAHLNTITRRCSVGRTEFPLLQLSLCFVVTDIDIMRRSSRLIRNRPRTEGRVEGDSAYLPDANPSVASDLESEASPLSHHPFRRPNQVKTKADTRIPKEESATNETVHQPQNLPQMSRVPSKGRLRRKHCDSYHQQRLSLLKSCLPHYLAYL
jgi:hypothetical protein